MIIIMIRLMMMTMMMMMMMMIMIRMMMMTMLSTLCSLGPADNPASLQNSLPPIFISCAAAVAKPSADRSRILAPQPQCTCNISRITSPRLPRPRRQCTGRARCPAAKPGSPATKASRAIVQWHGRKTTCDASASQVTASHAATCYDGDADDVDDNVSKRFAKWRSMAPDLVAVKSVVPPIVSTGRQNPLRTCL